MDAAVCASADAAIARGKDLLLGSEQRPSYIAEAERCFRCALELAPHNVEAMAHIGRALEDQGRWTEAKYWYDRALAIDPNYDFAIERDKEAQRQLGLDIDPERRRMLSRYPETIAELKDLKRAAQRFCVGAFAKDRLGITNKTKIITFGSCFAANLAHALNHRGVTTRNLGMGEIFNNSYSNLELIQWLFDIKPTLGDPFLHAFGDGKIEIAGWVRKADIVIYTLGVAACYFEADSGTFILPGRIEGVRGALNGRYIFRTTSVEENYRNLIALVTLIRERNPRCKFVFSVSPVPLAATLEARSVMEADCLSKATLRLAVEALVRDKPDCLYWPAFEIVRGLGVYVPQPYGEEDGSPFHVSDRVVRTIIDLFLEIHGQL